MKLLKPLPEFCMKTSLKGKNDLKYSSKLFINICSTEEIKRPTFENVTQEGQKGQSWKIPHITNKPRYDQDKKKAVCTTIDVAFHPHTFELLNRIPQFEKILCSTAIDSVEKQLKERNEIASRDYKILRKIKCKGGDPATMTIRGERLKDPEKQFDFDKNENRQQKEDYAPKLFQEFNQKQRELKEKKIEEEEKKKQEANKKELESEIEVKIEDLETKQEDQIECPKYKIFYSYATDYLV